MSCYLLRAIFEAYKLSWCRMRFLYADDNEADRDGLGKSVVVAEMMWGSKSSVLNMPAGKQEYRARE